MTASENSSVNAAMADEATLLERFERHWSSYWFEPLPKQRLRIFAVVMNLIVLFTVFRTDRWVADHGWAAEGFWQPIFVARVLHIPEPTTSTMLILQVVIALSAVGAILARRYRHVLSASVFLSYSLWLVWAFSYSKVDHDRLTIFVALAAISLVPDRKLDPDPLVGWALRTIQVVFVLAYPLSAVSKFQKSGLDWANSATFARAIVRRGTAFGDFVVNYPSLLVVGQWAFVIFEVLAIFALSTNTKVRNFFLAGILALHLFTYLAISIHFLPHTVCILAFFPLERWWARIRAGRTIEADEHLQRPTA